MLLLISGTSNRTGSTTLFGCCLGLRFDATGSFIPSEPNLVPPSPPRTGMPRSFPPKRLVEPSEATRLKATLLRKELVAGGRSGRGAEAEEEEEAEMARPCPRVHWELVEWEEEGSKDRVGLGRTGFEEWWSDE